MWDLIHAYGTWFSPTYTAWLHAYGTCLIHVADDAPMWDRIHAYGTRPIRFWYHSCIATLCCHLSLGSYVRHDFAQGVISLAHMLTWLVYMCDMNRLCVWHDLLVCVPWLVDAWHESCTSQATCDMTRLHLWHDWIISVTWLDYKCDMTRIHVWHDSFWCVTWL